MKDDLLEYVAEGQSMIFLAGYYTALAKVNEYLSFDDSNERIENIMIEAQEKNINLWYKACRELNYKMGKRYEKKNMKKKGRFKIYTFQTHSFFERVINHIKYFFSIK